RCPQALDHDPGDHAGGGRGQGVDPDEAPCSIVEAAPPLKPNQPNHSRAVPSTVIGMLCGLCAVEKRARRPMMTTSTSAEMPALMWTTVPPAKSMAGPNRLPIAPDSLSSPSPQTMNASGQYTRVTQAAEKTSHVENFARSATAPAMSAMAIIAKVEP